MGHRSGHNFIIIGWDVIDVFSFGDASIVATVTSSMVSSSEASSVLFSESESPGYVQGTRGDISSVVMLPLLLEALSSSLALSDSLSSRMMLRNDDAVDLEWLSPS